MSVLALPAELVLRIHRFLPPSSHFAFALANRQLVAYSTNVLEHHQKCRQIYHTCSSRRLDELESLLQTLCNDEIAAWHVREVQIFEKESDSDRARPSNNSKKTKKVSFHSNKASMESLAKTFLAVVHSLDSDRSDNSSLGSLSIIWQLHDSMTTGDPQALQMLIFTFCSRLRSVKFVHFPPAQQYQGHHQLDFGGDQFKLEDYRPHNYFSSIVRRISEIPRPMWLLGLQSLQYVAVGLHPDDIYYVDRTPLDPWNVGPLFLLPNIMFLYIRGLQCDADDDDDEGAERLALLLPAKSSSVQHLCFEEAKTHNIKYYVSTFIACPKDLKSVVFKNCGFNDFDRTVEDLAKHQGQSLETLLLCGDGDELKGYRCSKSPPESLDGLKIIRTLTVDIEDIRLSSMGEYHTNGDEDSMSGNVAKYHDFVEYFQTAIPTSIETLVFSSNRYEPMNAVDVRAIDDALLQLIVRQQCEHLKSIHLEAFHRGVRRSIAWLGGWSPIETWFPKTIDAGETYDIRIYTADVGGSTERCISAVCDGLFDLTLMPQAD